MRKKICVVTGSRAEYGLLKPLLAVLKGDGDIALQLVVTGMHLSPYFGSTYKEIAADGFKPAAKVDVLSRDDSSQGIADAIGKGISRFTGVYARVRPDMVVLLGDRFEIFSAAVAAYISRIPITHLYGGESTEGAFDEGLRHSITKMAYLHFVSHEAYRRRVMQLGEDPRRVFTVGALGSENIKNLKLWDKKRLARDLGIGLDRDFVVITFHPATLEDSTAGSQMEQLLRALDSFRGIGKIFTMPNADTGGNRIRSIISSYVKKNRKDAFVFASLGAVRYLSLVSKAKAVIGNSSSGIIEVPSFKIPTVNIGDRQKGRVKPSTVIDCAPTAPEIARAVRLALSDRFRSRCRKSANPYDKGIASVKIAKIIKRSVSKPVNLKKSFYTVK